MRAFVSAARCAALRACARGRAQILARDAGVAGKGRVHAPRVAGKGGCKLWSCTQGGVLLDIARPVATFYVDPKLTTGCVMGMRALLPKNARV